MQEFVLCALGAFMWLGEKPEFSSVSVQAEGIEQAVQVYLKHEYRSPHTAENVRVSLGKNADDNAMWPDLYEAAGGFANVEYDLIMPSGRRRPERIWWLNAPADTRQEEAFIVMVDGIEQGRYRSRQEYRKAIGRVEFYELQQHPEISVLPIIRSGQWEKCEIIHVHPDGKRYPAGEMHNAKPEPRKEWHIFWTDTGLARDGRQLADTSVYYETPEEAIRVAIASYRTAEKYDTWQECLAARQEKEGKNASPPTRGQFEVRQRGGDGLMYGPINL